MSLWEGLHPGVQEKVARLIHYTLNAEIRSEMAADESVPDIEPIPTQEADPDLLAALLAEPEPDVADLQPRVALPRRTIGGERGVERGVYSAAVGEEDCADGGDGDDGGEEVSDRENIDLLSEGEEDEGVTW